MFAVTVIIPAYDSSHFIANAIDSVLAQTFAPFEVIVIDDGSRDGTAKFVSDRYGSQVRLVSQPNAGPSAARNAGLAIARGNWVAFLDADDAWMPDKLQSQMEALRSDPTAVMSVAGCLKVAADGTVISENKLPQPLDSRTARRELAQRTLFPMNGVVARRDILERCGGFDTRLHCAEDRDLWIRLVAAGPFVAVHRPLARQLTHQRSLSSNPDLTLRDGLIVNRRALELLREPSNTDLTQALRLRQVNAKLYYSVALLYAWHNRRAKALASLLRSWALWPWPGSRLLKGQIGLLLRILRLRPIEF
jgi:glycosyltransferase involved in cell wall biosynthesis